MKPPRMASCRYGSAALGVQARASERRHVAKLVSGLQRTDGGARGVLPLSTLVRSLRFGVDRPFWHGTPQQVLKFGSKIVLTIKQLGSQSQSERVPRIRSTLNLMSSRLSDTVSASIEGGDKGEDWPGRKWLELSNCGGALGLFCDAHLPWCEKNHL